jgi:hypothetical protein
MAVLLVWAGRDRESPAEEMSEGDANGHFQKGARAFSAPRQAGAKDVSLQEILNLEKVN